MYPPIEVKVENITDEAQPLNHGFFTEKEYTHTHKKNHKQNAG